MRKHSVRHWQVVNAISRLDITKAWEMERPQVVMANDFLYAARYCRRAIAMHSMIFPLSSTTLLQTTTPLILASP